MEIKATDISARLLATENLSVVRANAQTASFDIVSRVLTIPLWKNMTPEIEDMLIAHEVGHALYTGMEYMAPIKESPKLKTYMNVLEDVRIEKLIKRTYPGLRKRMNDGYKQLIERDFFGIKQIQSLDELLLIDKINLYYKVGFSSGVSFTPEEKVFVDRAEKTETINDVIKLAEDIYNYSLEKHKETNTISIDDLDFDDAEDEIDADYDEDDSDLLDEEYRSAKDSEKTGYRSSRETRETEPDLQSITDSNMQQKLEDLADTDTIYRYWSFDNKYANEVVVDYKSVIKQSLCHRDYIAQQREDILKYYGSISEKCFDDNNKKNEENYIKFMKETDRTVNYLVKEFEMKKSASLYKRARIAKSGSLNLNKLYAYKLREDLFKQVMILPKGKNHGMVMLLDWSASMQHVMRDTVEQVISLSLFCKRVNIPFQVLAFTTAYLEQFSSEKRQEIFTRAKEHAKIMVESKKNVMDSNSNFHLLELFSSEMTMSEFTEMSKRLLLASLHKQSGFTLSGTPLNEALVWVYNNIGSFIKKYNIEKTTLITLTDGEGHTLIPYYGSENVYSSKIWMEDKHKWVRIKNLIKDDVTQKIYKFDNQNSQQTISLLSMIKDRFNINTVGFHIAENHKRMLMYAAQSNLPDYEGNFNYLIEDWRKQFRNNGFSLVKNAGRDELYIIPCSSTKVIDTELQIDSDSSAKSIAKSFTSFLSVKRTSRILLNRFINVVA
jgi:hypothetical protein